METTITLREVKNQDCITSHDLAVLADWAGKMKHEVANSDWKRAYALIREGADLLLRRRARSIMDIPKKKPEQSFAEVTKSYLNNPLPEIDTGATTGILMTSGNPIEHAVSSGIPIVQLRKE